MVPPVGNGRAIGCKLDRPEHHRPQPALIPSDRTMARVPSYPRRPQPQPTRVPVWAFSPSVE